MLLDKYNFKNYSSDLHLLHPKRNPAVANEMIMASFGWGVARRLQFAEVTRALVHRLYVYSSLCLAAVTAHSVIVLVLLTERGVAQWHRILAQMDELQRMFSVK